jgi:Ser/Thr protein kinase RdoA (MazF antagonist)
VRERVKVVRYRYYVPHGTSCGDNGDGNRIFNGNRGCVVRGEQQQGGEQAAVPGAVLAAWGLPPGSARPLGRGLINQTWLAEEAGRGRLVLQRLNPVFSARVNEDIEAVTRHLERKGLVTPRLIPNRQGALWCDHAGVAWRALTWVDGASLEAFSTSAQAREAGALLARFHRAVSDLQHAFRNARLGVHDTARHLANLRLALEQHRDHPRYAAVQPLGERILEAAAARPALPPLPDRIVHGDPKANNILFSADGRRALCLIDLDTLSRMPLPLELGDAFRSWCNPAGENDTQASFSTELFAAGIAGYAGEAGGFIQPAEWRAIVPATHTIYVELAARFCADALNERYFGWDPGKFASRSEHNRVRAESQLRAANSLLAQRGEADALVSAAFGGS